jgi:threonine dehydrogenase-like Zn-dependent dehydrogenase
MSSPYRARREEDPVPETMQAVVCHGPRDYRMEKVTRPEPGPGQALVRVQAVGICASDLKCYQGAAKFWGDANRPAWAETEVIPGHEFVGEVVELDAEAADRWGIDVGDRVVSEQIVKDLTGGYGADVYLEGTGHPSAVPQGLNLLRKLGTFVEYSVFKDDVSVDWSIISDDKELDVLGAHLGPHCWPAAIRMIESGRLPMDRICTHQLPLERFQEGLDLVAEGTKSIKVSLFPE